MKEYIGSYLQIRGAEKYILQNGKGDGMHFLFVRNGMGLEAWISLDRAGDISRINFRGDNMAFFSPCGYVAPAYYDEKGLGFLKSFTAGFFTTCGLTAVGSPCVDDGEELPLHGNVSNIPAELLCIDETKDSIVIKLKIEDKVIFGRKLVMLRTYTFSYSENSFSVSDEVTNEGDNTSPYMIMYHCNLGYPLLSENSIVKIPYNDIKPREENAAKYIDSALQMEKPQANYTERCYYYDVKEKDNLARVGIFSPDINKGVVFRYSKETLPKFTQWKMMGKTDYVLGLEPGNCTPDGRDVLRKNGELKFIEPEETIKTGITFKFTDNMEEFNTEF